MTALLSSLQPVRPRRLLQATSVAVLLALAAGAVQASALSSTAVQSLTTAQRA